MAVQCSATGLAFVVRTSMESLGPFQSLKSVWTERSGLGNILEAGQGHPALVLTSTSFRCSFLSIQLVLFPEPGPYFPTPDPSSCFLALCSWLHSFPTLLYQKYHNCSSFPQCSTAERLRARGTLRWGGRGRGHWAVRMLGWADERICMVNLPTNVREKDVEDLFYKYGRIREIELKNGHCLVPFAFVRFEDPRDAEDAIYGRNSYDYGQCRLRVEFSRTYRGLPPSGSWQDLKDHMREVGDVCYADVQKDGVGMVEYLRKEDMEYALPKLDDTKFCSHDTETSYSRVHPERSTSYGYSWSLSGSRGHDSPY
ncbi:serine/arginine-rich splicing factor 9-like [Nomascus leucogenys]|uniref:serine/arginine-rich splicing factor 9-like n=1 Tax=Nomascus leucogenys TaxID=61853 RepID=UPI00122D8DC1|nr:serine/arginine-rich splicing factor 9-like [Nomascus leucogenys]